LTLLLNLLKAFGLDIPARVAELKARIEQRVEDAADQAVHVVQDIAVTVALVCCAAITALAAIAVGLVALARWVADLYGPFAGLAAVGAAREIPGRGSAVGGQAVGDLCRRRAAVARRTSRTCAGWWADVSRRVDASRRRGLVDG
jgi:hypothetical protein